MIPKQIPFYLPVMKDIRYQACQYHFLFCLTGVIMRQVGSISLDKISLCFSFLLKMTIWNKTRPRAPVPCFLSLMTSMIWKTWVKHITVLHYMHQIEKGDPDKPVSALVLCKQTCIYMIIILIDILPINTKMVLLYLFEYYFTTFWYMSCSCSHPKQNKKTQKN